MPDTPKKKPAKKRYVRKRVRIFNLIDKIKLWPSRRGVLHGIRTIEIMAGPGSQEASKSARLVTHCNKEFIISNSQNSRAGRWLRNKWFTRVCPVCGVPQWKLEKFDSTYFKRHQGTMLDTASKKDPPQ